MSLGSFLTRVSGRSSGYAKRSGGLASAAVSALSQQQSENFLSGQSSIKYEPDLNSGASSK